jgi:hypothetical protein
MEKLFERYHPELHYMRDRDPNGWKSMDSDQAKPRHP